MDTKKTMKDERIRLNKFLASHGVCSRREADQLIAQGKVLVNQKVAPMGLTLDGSEEVVVNGRKLNVAPKKVVLAYYKPVGITCTEKDAHAAQTVIENLGYESRVTYAGRLDRESEGLLLMSNDGDLMHAMMQGSSRHEKEYIVKVHRELDEGQLRQMAKGVYLPELSQTTRTCEIEKIGKYTFRIVLTQGLNRQIRRMCKEFGYRVEHLKRIRVCNITLGNLKPGAYRELSEEELRQLHALVMPSHGA